MSYNWWTNRETWLVNLHFNPQNKSDLDFIKEQIDEIESNIDNDFLKDYVDFSLIDWNDLEENLSDDDDDDDDDDDE